MSRLFSRKSSKSRRKTHGNSNSKNDRCNSRKAAVLKEKQRAVYGSTRTRTRSEGSPSDAKRSASTSRKTQKDDTHHISKHWMESFVDDEDDALDTATALEKGDKVEHKNKNK